MIDSYKSEFGTFDLIPNRFVHDLARAIPRADDIIFDMDGIIFDVFPPAPQLSPEDAALISPTHKYPNPFMQGHCVVNAVSHVKAEPTPQFAIDLAAKAYEARREVRHPLEQRDAMRGHDVTRLLDPRDGAGYIRHPEDTKAWLALAGLREVERIEYGTYEESGKGPPLRDFARDHPTGRWIVGIPMHAVALVDGHIYGIEGRGIFSPVTVAIRVEEIDETPTPA